MNTSIAVDSNPQPENNSGITRTSILAVFVVVGLILLYAANRACRHHKGGRQKRY
jgi:hypothetical protein